MLSSRHLLFTLCHPSISFFPPFPSSPMPRSTHSRLPISLKRLNARANANRSSSPENTLLFFNMFMFMPRSSMRLRITSETSCSWSGAALEGDGFLAEAVAEAGSVPALLEVEIASESSDSERKREVSGTAVVRTSLAYAPHLLAFRLPLVSSRVWDRWGIATYPAFIDSIHKRDEPPRQIPTLMIHARHLRHNKSIVVPR